MFLASSFSILIIEAILLIISIDAKKVDLENDYLAYRTSVAKSEVFYRFTEKGRDEILSVYARNIIYLTLIIVLFVSFVVIICFHFVVGRHILFFIKNNEDNKVNNSVTLFKDSYEIPNSELGLLMKSRDDMISNLQSYHENSFNLSKLSSLGEMAGGIAHEINNPLAIISGNTMVIRKMIEKDMINIEKVNHAISNVDKTVRRISEIISGLRNISRDASEEEKSKFKLVEILNDIIPIFLEKFKSQGVEIRLNYGEGIEELEVDVMRIQLSQVIINLISNAYYEVLTREEKWIEISIHTLGENLLIKTIDSGSGIPIEIQNKVFEPFFTTKVIGEGTGLGLSVSSSIIRRHKGSLYIDNDHPHTCFVISLPLDIDKFS